MRRISIWMRFLEFEYWIFRLNLENSQGYMTFSHFTLLNTLKVDHTIVNNLDFFCAPQPIAGSCSIKVGYKYLTLILWGTLEDHLLYQDELSLYFIHLYHLHFDYSFITESKSLIFCIRVKHQQTKKSEEGISINKFRNLGVPLLKLITSTKRESKVLTHLFSFTQTMVLKVEFSVAKHSFRQEKF